MENDYTDTRHTVAANYHNTASAASALKQRKSGILILAVFLRFERLYISDVKLHYHKTKTPCMA